MRTKTRLAAGAATAAILIGGAVSGATPAYAGATGGGCAAYAQVTACVSEGSNGQIWADAYVNGGYPGCWLDIKLYETETNPWYILNEQGYPCDNGGHKGPIGYNFNVRSGTQLYSHFATYATLNNGASSLSPVQCTEYAPPC